ncbi:MAG: type II toxin-antitoxin system HicB family antitoxin [Eubacteriales bacterium]|nr:type II toxin-antitoxin system HicB family antitoxin [Eubacteriales bacterium]
MKKTERYFYPAVFGYEPGEEISVDFPDLSVATSGKNENDALLSARELLGCTLFGLEEDLVTIPSPTPLSNIKCKENERVVLIDVYMPSIRLARINRSVHRTVTLPAWLNAAALERNINFSQVLQDALKEMLPSQNEQNTSSLNHS